MCEPGKDVWCGKVPTHWRMEITIFLHKVCSSWKHSPLWYLQRALWVFFCRWNSWPCPGKDLSSEVPEDRALTMWRTFTAEDKTCMEKNFMANLCINPVLHSATLSRSTLRMVAYKMYFIILSLSSRCWKNIGYKLCCQEWDQQNSGKALTRVDHGYPRAQQLLSQSRISHGLYKSSNFEQFSTHSTLTKH